MRSDMAKVVVERPRHWRDHAYASKRSHKRASTLMGDDAPSKEPIRPYGDRKVFSDHLGPLRRFLSANIGRPWNKVHSEICACIRPTSTTQRHVLEHVEHYVERDIVKIERGVPYYLGYRGLEALHCYRDHDQFFVHPRTGLLLPAPVRARKRPRDLVRDDEKVPVRIVEGVVYARFDGLWFRPVLDDKPPDVRFADVIGRDVVRGKYASSKGKQLSSRELRDLSLVNTR